MDISKVSVVDPRIVQHKPKFAVEKGALSITNQTFSAIANSASQQTFQVQVPSENVFVDRAVDWVNTANLIVTVNYSNAPAQYTALAHPGVNFSLAPFPVTQTVSTYTATINDQSLTVNVADVLPQILRLADLAKTRTQRTCPTMLDKYQSVQDASTVLNSPVGAWGSTYDPSNVPCGAWGDLSFYVPQGETNVTISTTGSLNGVPRGLPYVTASVANKPYSFGVRFTTAEKLVLPPFIFADEDELSTGLFGVQNIQFTANFNAPTRAIRMVNSTAYSSSPSVAWAGVSDTGTLPSPFTKALLQVQFLTPSLDVPLPSKSIVSWMEFPRYISPVQTAFTAGNTSLTQLQSQTITLPSIPDLLVIYVKPQSYASPSECDWSLPISKISISFDNFSGLLANHSAYELYKMSVANGLDMDWDEWSGSAWVNGSNVPQATTAALEFQGLTPLVGGPLVLRPGRDFALSTGQAPGLVGNFTLQYDLQVDNTVAQSTSSTMSIYTVCVNSGFFETIRGSSRILKGVVTEQDILGAPVASVDSSMERLVGGKKHHMKKHHGLSHLLR